MKLYTPQEYVPTSDKTRIIKRALKAHFPKGTKISVTKGQGTASGWITAKVTIDKPADCEDKESEYCRCRNCNLLQKDTSEMVDKIAVTALAEVGTKFTTYTADDGYNSQHICFNVSINFKPLCQN